MEIRSGQRLKSRFVAALSALLVLAVALVGLAGLPVVEQRTPLAEAPLSTSDLVQVLAEEGALPSAASRMRQRSRFAGWPPALPSAAVRATRPASGVLSPPREFDSHCGCGAPLIC